MDIRKLEEVDAKLGNGLWVDDLPHLEGVSLLVRPITAPGVQSRITRLTIAARLASANSQDDLAPEISESIERKVLTERVLLEWQGLTAGDTDVPFTPENVERCMALPVFLEAVRTASQIAAARVQKEVAETSKNSQGSSGGKSSKAAPRQRKAGPKS